MIATVTEMITMSQNARSTLKRVILAVSLVLCASSAFAQGTPVPYTIPQYFDANGDPLALGGICTYEAGTTTLANVYTTSALAVAFPNPVRLNASGRPSVSGVTLGIFLSPGRAYKFVLKDATVTTCSPDTGVTLWSVDNVQAVPGSGSSLDVTGTAGEAISAGDVVYMSTGDGGTNVGQWYKTDADFTTKSTSTFQVGVAPSAIAAAATGTIRISGSVTVAGPLSTGAAYYVGATQGAIVTTPPTNALRIGQAAVGDRVNDRLHVAPVEPARATVWPAHAHNRAPRHDCRCHWRERDDALLRALRRLQSDRPLRRHDLGAQCVRADFDRGPGHDLADVRRLRV
jgi:hypothetical protein